MQHKREGGLRNLPACSDDVNDMYFVSTQHFFSRSLGNSKVSRIMPGAMTITKKAENK